jgi:hypothetical protein
MTKQIKLVITPPAKKGYVNAITPTSSVDQNATRVDQQQPVDHLSLLLTCVSTSPSPPLHSSRLYFVSCSSFSPLLFFTTTLPEEQTNKKMATIIQSSSSSSSAARPSNYHLVLDNKIHSSPPTPQPGRAPAAHILKCGICLENFERVSLKDLPSYQGHVTPTLTNPASPATDRQAEVWYPDLV